MNIVQLSITLNCCIRSSHLPHFKTKVACIWIPKNHVNYIELLHLMSNFFEFGMTGPLNESISCFLIRVDHWVLVPSPLEHYTSSPSEGYTPASSEDYTSSPSEGYTPSPSEDYTSSISKDCTSSPSKNYTSSPSEGYASLPSEDYTFSPLEGCMPLPSEDNTSSPS